MRRKANITVFNADDHIDEVWELIVDTDDNEFYLLWPDNGYDMTVAEMWPSWFDDVTWSSESSRVMLIGLFEIGLED